MTVRVFRGDAEAWVDLERVFIGQDEHRVEAARAYRDRLVLKLVGLDDARYAAELKGETLAVAPELAASKRREDLPPDLLEGLAVLDEAGRRLGRVVRVMETGGVDLLVVRLVGADGQEEDDREDALIPLAEEIVLDIDPDAGVVRVRPPEGLLELNRADPSV